MTDAPISAPPRPILGLMLPAIANPGDGRVDTARLLEAARRAEAAGFDGVYVGDHLLHPLPLLEAIVTLSAVAASTSRTSLGTCVMLAALRDPLWLAKQLGSLDAFAPGRLRIGIGVGGEYPAEFAAADVALPERGERVEAVVQQVRAYLAGGFTPAIGGPSVRLAPIPEQPIPFLLAGWKDVALRRAAAIGDGWIGYLLSPESFARRRARLLERRETCGGAPFVTGMLLPVHPVAGSGNAHAEAAAAWVRITNSEANFPERLFVAGRADQIVEQLHHYWQLGCGEMVISLVDQGPSYLDQLDLLATEVLPRVRAF